MSNKKAIIIGAGPAGLTAAFELLAKTDIKPIIFEKSEYIGGICRTINYKGNRIDIGGHRFFSKSDKIMQWWQNIMPLQGKPSKDDIIVGRDVCLSDIAGAPDPEKDDNVMLARARLSRILFLRKFFDYPIALNLKTFTNLGIVRVIKAGVSYVRIRLFPIKPEKSLEDFFINRFGRELYLTFFKDYTEKLWGIDCDKIKPEWGAQRVKGVSITKALFHAVKKIYLKDASLSQKGTETSLIDKFMYPKYGPGQIWGEVAKIIQEKGGEIHLNRAIVDINNSDNKIISVDVKDNSTGKIDTFTADYFFSTMPIRELIPALLQSAPVNIQEIAKGLLYRDFITAGLLLKKFKIKNESKIKTVNGIIPDNWIYIQEKDVKVGRLQIFNNWSPYLVGDDKNVWVGLEYFCTEGDELWNKKDEDFLQFAIDELVKINVINREDVLDGTIIRKEKAYPAYFGTYDKLDEAKKFLNQFENLFLIGRNGMHRYNNMDHSMLTAMTAVDNIINNVKTKDNIWSINTEEDYHESDNKK